MPKKFSPSKKKKDLSKKGVACFLSCCMTIFILFLTGENLRSYLSKEKVLGIKTEASLETNKLISEKVYWEEVISKNPSYLPGLIELVKINYSLGNTDKAIVYLNIAKLVDPNSEEIKNLSQRIIK